MSPVASSRSRNPRAVLVAAVTLLIGVVAILALFVFAIPSLTEEGTIEVRLGPERFDAGSAELRAPSIAADGPLLFSDVAGGDRDIYVQHVGDDPRSGWYAFDARRPGQPRDCFLRWDPERDRFVDACDGVEVSAVGDGLPQYPVEVREADGHVIVDLRPPDPAGSTTTSTVEVTGTLAP